MKAYNIDYKSKNSIWCHSMLLTMFFFGGWVFGIGLTSIRTTVITRTDRRVKGWFRNGWMGGWMGGGMGGWVGGGMDIMGEDRDRYL